MEKKRFFNKLTVLCVVIAMLLSLAGCGKPAAVPDPSNNTGESMNESPSSQDSAQQGGGSTDDNESQQKTVKNVIFMIADGGGYDNYTLAEKVKQTLMQQAKTQLAGAKTTVTTDALAGIGKASVTGLYLDELLVGSANTLLVVPHGNTSDFKSYITDSSAAGTALSSGYKTTYCYAGIDSDRNPRASIVELARMKGMSTGLVTTKSYVDATPLAFFTGHAIHRHQYQDTSLQALLSGIDVVIGEGTEYGDLVDVPTSHPNVSASSMGYSVARNKTQLLSVANNAATKKLWAPILGVYNSFGELKEEEVDLGSDRISYDVEAGLSTEQPSLLDMTKAALQVLGSNINDPDGFFLMVEGGALDNAAETGCLRSAVGEYLAFDEAFGYCVQWAAQRGDTMVIAVPDHDSGGFSGIETCEKALIDGIISGYLGDTEFYSTMPFGEIVEALDDMGENTDSMELLSGHTDMAVPISLYAPEGIKADLLQQMGLPTGGSVRLGDSQYYVPNASDSMTWYSSSALSGEHVIENTKIAPAIATVLDLGSFDDATKQLFNAVCHIDGDGNMTDAKGSVTFGDTAYETDYSEYYDCMFTAKGLTVERNSTGYTLNATDTENKKIGNLLPLSIFVLDSTDDPKAGTFYVPASVLSLLNQ